MFVCSKKNYLIADHQSKSIIIFRICGRIYSLSCKTYSQTITEIRMEEFEFGYLMSTTIVNSRNHKTLQNKCNLQINVNGIKTLTTKGELGYTKKGRIGEITKK